MKPIDAKGETNILRVARQKKPGQEWGVTCNHYLENRSAAKPTYVQGLVHL